MNKPAKTEGIRMTVLFLSIIGIASGILLSNGAILQDLMDNVNPSFLPGF